MPGNIQPEELDRLLALHRVVHELSQHYHDKMWEAGRHYFSLYSLLISASFLLFRLYPNKALATFLAMLLAIFSVRAAVVGNRILQQQRGYFAYFLTVRKKIDAALGWMLYQPQPRPLRAIWGMRLPAPTPMDFRYRPCADLTSENSANMLSFNAQDQSDIAATLVAKTGVYGIMRETFAWALIGSGALIVFYTLAILKYAGAIDPGAMLEAVRHGLLNHLK
jgi:hypothetical protein